MYECIFVTMDHKTSLKLHGYICSTSQKHIVWVKIIDLSFMPKSIRKLSKDRVPWIFLYIAYRKYLKTSLLISNMHC